MRFMQLCGKELPQVNFNTLHTPAMFALVYRNTP